MAGQVKAICLSKKKGTAKIPVEKIEVIRHGKVRRAKLYYLRALTGKKARIAERRR